jgi:preprotein translocase subunit YajC
MTWKAGQRVQDDAGFTGTVSAQWDDEVEVTWDVSGCTSDLKENQIKPIVDGQDASSIQRKIHASVFGADA